MGLYKPSKMGGWWSLYPHEFGVFRFPFFCDGCGFGILGCWDVCLLGFLPLLFLVFGPFAFMISLQYAATIVQTTHKTSISKNKRTMIILDKKDKIQQSNLGVQFHNIQSRLVVLNMLYFPHIGKNNPNWRTISFFRGEGIPPTSNETIQVQRSSASILPDFAPWQGWRTSSTLRWAARGKWEICASQEFLVMRKPHSMAVMWV